MLGDEPQPWFKKGKALACCKARNVKERKRLRLDAKGRGMGLKIDVTTVARVLLSDGTWYDVLPGSLTMDTFQWTDQQGITISSVDVEVLPPMGIRFKTRGISGWLSCPLTSVVAVHYEPVELGDPLAVEMPALLADELERPSP